MDEMKLKMLDDLERKMDEHDVNMYNARKEPKGIVVAEEKQIVEPNPEDKKTPNPNTLEPAGEGGKNPDNSKGMFDRKKRDYLDKNRQDVLDRVEAKNDPIMMRGQFNRSYKARG